MNIKIAKLILSLKNASKIKQTTTLISFSPTNLLVTTLLYNEGLIQSFKVKKIKDKSTAIQVFLRYSEGKDVLVSLKLISKPSLSKYFSYFELCFISNKFFFGALSMDKKIISLSDCKRLKVGGQFLFLCV